MRRCVAATLVQSYPKLSAEAAKQTAGQACKFYIVTRENTYAVATEKSDILHRLLLSFLVSNGHNSMLYAYIV